ncbi:MAG TPA: hypothetical protein VGI31_08670 [Streptosporangiaceae bacterium]
MRTATGLTVVAIGAILAFAVTTNTSVFNLHIAGFVIMLAGLAGLFIPRRHYSAISKRLVQRRTRTWPDGTVVETQETSLPPYVVQNPETAIDDAGLPAVPSLQPDPTVRTVMTPGGEDSEVVEQLRDE